MVISDEIRKLQDLHSSGALTDDEFTQAKARVLSSERSVRESQGLPLQEHLQHVEFQQELERIDREWDIERRQYVVTGRYGGEHVPSEGSSMIGALVIGGFGLAWTIGAASMGAPAIFPVFGVVFILLGVGNCISAFGKAGEYQQAYKLYQQRRQQLLAKQKTNRI
jgi:hypothetical protein